MKKDENKYCFFFDRDNTLTKDNGYTYKLEEFEWIEGAPQTLKLLHDLSIPVFIVTNQGGIGRGFFTVNDMIKFHQKLCLEAERVGGKIKDIAFCPHHPLAITNKYKTPCSCRKPKPGMILNLSKKWKLNLKKSILIGDKKTDVDAGRSAGCLTYKYNNQEKLNIFVLRILKNNKII